MPTGWMASLRKPGISNVIFFVTSRLTGSITETVPPISDDTHTSELSRLNSAKRGRESTSTLATILCVDVSMIDRFQAGSAGAVGVAAEHRHLTSRVRRHRLDQRHRRAHLCKNHAARRALCDGDRQGVSAPSY